LDQLTEAEQARRNVLLEGDRFREAHAASLAAAELTSADATIETNNEVECLPLESRRSSWDWDVGSQHSSASSDMEYSQQDGLQEEPGEIGSISQAQFMQYVEGITQRRISMLSGMTTLPHPPVGFHYVEDKYVCAHHLSPLSPVSRGSVFLAHVEEDGSVGSTIYIGSASDSHPPPPRSSPEVD
jgi:hypothetical protein